VVRKTILCVKFLSFCVSDSPIAKVIGIQFVGLEPIDAVPKSNINLISYS